MNRDNKSASSNDKLDLEVQFWCIKLGKLPKMWLISKQGNPQSSDLKPDFWISFTTLFLFQGNAQSSNLKPDFWNSVTKQTQQFLCTNNT